VRHGPPVSLMTSFTKHYLDILYTLRERLCRHRQLVDAVLRSLLL
jgi:hypothetical protein